MANGKEDALINIVERLTARVNELELGYAVLHTQIETAVHRINNLEVLIDNLRVEFKHHDHPYKSPPVYGGGSL